MDNHKLNEWLAQNKFAISEPLQINQTIANATTPLMHSARLGDLDVLNALLARGADTELMTLDDFTALELAANRECMKMLRKTKVAAHA